MELQAVTRIPATRVRRYSEAEWNAKRALIRHLFLGERRTVSEIITILAQEHDFHVNTQMVTYRLGRCWNLQKNCTKAVVESFVRSGGSRESTLGVRDGEYKARVIRAARRHGIQLPSTMSPPDPDRHALWILTSVSHYVDGVIDRNQQSIDEVPNKIVQEYLSWAYGATPSAFRLLNYLALARLCYQKEKSGWAWLILRPAFAELDICLRDEPYQALPVILGMFGAFGELPPRAGSMLLHHCLGLSRTFAEAHPIRQMFEQVWRWIEQGSEGSKERKERKDNKKSNGNNDAFSRYVAQQAAICFIEKLEARLGDHGRFACTLLRPLNGGAMAKALSDSLFRHRWIDPVECRVLNPQYFDVSLNVERCIVHAVEFRGHAELLRVRTALEQQRAATQSDEVREMLSKHLQALEVPIQRIGYRDCLMGGDQDGFLAYWHQLTDHLDPADHALDSEHLKDMLVAWKFFEEWKWAEEAQKLQRRVEYLLIIIHQKMSQG